MPWSSNEAVSALDALRVFSPVDLVFMELEVGPLASILPTLRIRGGVLLGVTYAYE